MNKIKKFKSEFDLVISISSTSNSGVLGCLISKKLGIPFIILEHMTLYQRKLIRFWHKRFLRKVQNLAKIIAPVSEPLDASLKKFNPNINTCVIYNPISDFMFENTTSDLSSHLKDFAGGSFCFGAWTTWRKIKRLDLLLGAFSEFKLKSRKSCKLIVGGKFADKKLVYKMKKDPDILFLGALSRKDINVLSAFIDCCILCSDHETFGLPIAEAMAKGKPVIATKCGGIENLIDDSLGLVIEKNDLGSLVKAMDYVSRENLFSSHKIKTFAQNSDIFFSQFSIKQVHSYMIIS